MKTKKLISIYRKLACLLLVLSITFSLNGCSLPFNLAKNNSTLSQSAGTENEAFSDFIYQLFCDAVSSDTLTLHSFIQTPSNYKITDYDVTLGGYDLENLDGTTDLTECLTTLNSFSKDTLSEKQRITYEQLKIFLETQLEYSDLYLLGSQLSTTIGIQVQLPIIFAEYKFNEKKDIDEYLLLLQDTDEYYSNLIEFEKLRAAKGYFMSDELADEIITQCQTFIDTASAGYLITTFNEKIDAFSGLSDEEKITYKHTNTDAVNNHMIKAYTILRDGLASLRGSCKYTGGLCNFPDGTKYFEFLLKENLGWSKSIDQFDALLDSYLTYYMTGMQMLMLKDNSLLDKFDTFTFSLTEPGAIIEDLKGRIFENYPDIPEVNYSIKYIDKSLEDYASPAMYFTPQIDNLSENSIYINSGATSGNELYPTLAHEGYPGHLYQTQYFASKNPEPLRYIMASRGYVEGWATYVEVSSYEYAQTDNPLLNSLMAYNYATILCLYGKVDIGVNYKGWTADDVYNYISAYGFNDKSTAQDMYKSMVSEPGNYSKYVLGFLGFNELKKEAQNKLGSNFNLKNFHKYVLDYGSVPFDMLFNGLEAWAFAN
ncbi:MAG: DUF885 domain-containing protein [Eubacteriales bacterium]|nr:DUF885 domain-containing protein [Eubacteriales bacterium]